MPGQFDDAFVNAVSVYQNDGEPSPTIIGGLTDQNAVTQLDVRGNAHSGLVYEEHQSIYQRRPELPITSHALKAVLQMLGTSGNVALHRKIDGTAVGFDMYTQAVDPCGTRKSGSTHTKYSIKKGLLVLGQITGNHQDDATVLLRNVAALDPNNTTADPMTVTQNVTLPDLTQGNLRYGFYGGTINGNEFVGTQNFTLNVGAQTQVIDTDGVVDPTLLFIDQFQPRINISGINPTWFGSGAGQIPLEGQITSQVTSAFYFRRREHGNIYYEKNQAQHIKISFSGMTTVDTGYQAGGRSPGTTSLTIYCAYEGALLPIKVEYDVTIPI